VRCIDEGIGAQRRRDISSGIRWLLNPGPLPCPAGGTGRGILLEEVRTTIMKSELGAAEIRVLGCLLEKEMATPEYYPLSLNALLAACNQKTNRDPVVSYGEDTVQGALEELKRLQLVWQSDAGRVPRYAHRVEKALNLVRREEAVLCLLMLKGAQTPGEIRGRSERLYSFADLEEVNLTLEHLEEMGLARRMPRQPGRKESRYDHLLGAGTAQDGPPTPSPGPEAATEDASGETSRIAMLEEEMKDLRRELEDLKAAFLLFRKQLE